MSNPNIAKLKKRAADFEQKKQFDRALSLYIQLLEEAGRDLDDADLQLFNRVGDLLQRQGNVSEALAYYEKAVDVYAERGFLNNAIALCNKILRQSPARTAVYYKLGKISASKGFKSDAKKNFLEYADRMQKGGHIDEAFRALKEFADLCPDQDDIRLMLAEWLNKENRKSEAIEQLEMLYSKLESEGRQAEARATIDRIKAIDPEVVPRASGAWMAQKSNDLVFLDLGGEAVAPRADAPAPVSKSPTPVPAAPSSAATPRVAALDGLVLTFHPDDESDDADAESSEAAPSVIAGFEATSVTPVDATGATEPLAATGGEIAPLGADVEVGASQAPESPAREAHALDALVATVEGLQLTVADPPLDPVSTLSLLDADRAGGPETFVAPDDPIPLLTGLETPRVTLSGAHPSLAPLLDEPPMSGSEFATLALDTESSDEATARPLHDLALPSNLPLLAGDAPAPVSDASGEVDLLRIVAAPVGLIAGDADAAPPAGALLDPPELGEIDLTSLPPLSALVALGGQSAHPVTGSSSPLDAPEVANEADPGLLAVAHDALSLGTDHVPSPEPRTERDTAELEAQDATARRTDEILIVPSEEIDEETKRSLRLEFALDGEETPDAWIEAALGSRDDRSRDRTFDRLLTPLGVEAIVLAEDAPRDQVAVPPDARTGAVEQPEAQFEGGAVRDDDTTDEGDEAAASSEEQTLDLAAELPPLRDADAASLPEIDLLDELTPPFMRHDGAHGDASQAALAESTNDDRERAAQATPPRGSALDVDALRAAVDEREPQPARRDAESPEQGEPPLLDTAQIEAAFSERDVDLPLLEIGDLVGEAPSVFTPLDPLEIAPFSVDELLGASPSFDGGEPSSFVPDPPLSSETLTPSPSDENAPSDETAAAGSLEPTVASEAGEEWPDDAAPVVLIDGEWRAEHMGDLVSGEVRAVGVADEGPGHPTPRFDDLAAALMWPGGEDEGSLRRMHTPRSTLSFGGVEAQLRRRLELDPGNVALRRQLGEVLMDQGDREGGLVELDVAMRTYELANDLEGARAIADVVLRVIPTSVRHHQKRVEYAVRANDRVRLVEAYVELADSLFRSGEPDKARVVYSRVLELAPGNGRARFALGLLEPEGEGESDARRTASPSMAALFDPPETPDSTPVVRTPTYVALPAIEEIEQPRMAHGALAETPAIAHTSSLEGRLSAESLDVDRAEGTRSSVADAASDAAEVAEEDHAPRPADLLPVEEEEDGEGDAVEPFPPPTLDAEIDAAFAQPPVVEESGAPIAADLRGDFDGPGTPPVGVSSLVTLRAEEATAVPVGRATVDTTPAPEAESAPGESTGRPPSLLNEVGRSTGSDDDFVDLGSWLREDEPVRTTRMVTAEAAPTGDEQADFDEMLRRFKMGVAANLDDEDYASHYDLGVAYKEMGLIDEAIAEFQRSLRGDTHRVRSYEALGQCFVEKGQHQVAVTLLRRAAESTGADDQQLVGVLYLLGYASEVMARHADALGYYQRVFAVDIEFRDVAQRVAAMELRTQ